MAVVGLVVHERRQEAIDQAADLAQWLSDEGHVVHHPLVGESSHDLDLVVSLGGDGSILRAVDLNQMFRYLELILVNLAI